MMDWYYLLGSVLFCFVYFRQIQIIANSDFRDFYFAGKVLFMVFNLAVVVSVGLALYTDSRDLAAFLYLVLAFIAFWAYYLKKQFK